MASIKVDTLDYRPLASDSPDYVAQFGASGGNVYTVDTRTAIKMSPDAVPPNWLTVDNSQGAGYVFVSFNGNYQFSALPFTRDRFRLAPGTNVLVITADADVLTPATISISSAPLADTTSNQFAIQEAVTQVLFPFQTPFTASRAMTGLDNKTSLLFITTNGLGPYAYNLDPTTAIGNEWMNYIYNEPAVGDVGDTLYLVPSGTDQVNGNIFFEVPPGSGGVLMCNGVDWYFTGFAGPQRTMSFYDSAFPRLAIEQWSGTLGAGTGNGIYFPSAAPLAAFLAFAFNYSDRYLFANQTMYAPDGNNIGNQPAYSFRLDPDTGFRRSGANQMTHTVGAVDQLQISTTTINLLNGRLTWPVTQNPSTDPNTMDDYEEGTWTPNLQFGGASVGMAYASRSGDYSIIGNTVTALCDFTLSAKGVSVGAATLSALPLGLTVSGTSPAITVHPTGMAGLTGMVGATTIGGATVVFRQSAAGGMVGISDAVFTNASSMRVSFNFFV